MPAARPATTTSPTTPDDKDVGAPGGRGARVSGAVSFPAGTPLHILLGGLAGPFHWGDVNQGVTSFNGGGAFGNDDNNLGVGATYSTAAGGGASDVRTVEAGQPGSVRVAVCSSPVAEAVAAAWARRSIVGRRQRRRRRRARCRHDVGQRRPRPVRRPARQDVRRRRGRQPQGYRRRARPGRPGRLRVHRSGRRRRRRVLRRRRRRLKLRQRHSLPP